MWFVPERFADAAPGGDPEAHGKIGPSRFLPSEQGFSPCGDLEGFLNRLCILVALLYADVGSGQLCSIRDKSGVLDQKPSLQRTVGQSMSRLELRVALGFALAARRAEPRQSVDDLCAIYCGSLTLKIQHIVLGTFPRRCYSRFTIYEPMCFRADRVGTYAEKATKGSYGVSEPKPNNPDQACMVS
jgi:hypothetical protein